MSQVEKWKKYQSQFLIKQNSCLSIAICCFTSVTSFGTSGQHGRQCRDCCVMHYLSVKVAYPSEIQSQATEDETVSHARAQVFLLTIRIGTKEANKTTRPQHR